MVLLLPQDQMAIACGSRAHLEKESIAQVRLSKAAVYSSLLAFNPILHIQARLLRNGFLCFLSKIRFPSTSLEFMQD